MKECLLKVRQTLVHIGDLPKKPITGNQIEPLSFQKVRPESGQLGIIGLKHFVLPSGIRKYHFNMCYYI
jgi:hypothetical protein